MNTVVSRLRSAPSLEALLALRSEESSTWVEGRWDRGLPAASCCPARCPPAQPCVDRPAALRSERIDAGAVWPTIVRSRAVKSLKGRAGMALRWWRSGGLSWRWCWSRRLRPSRRPGTRSRTGSEGWAPPTGRTDGAGDHGVDWGRLHPQCLVGHSRVQRFNAAGVFQTSFPIRQNSSANGLTVDSGAAARCMWLRLEGILWWRCGSSPPTEICVSTCASSSGTSIPGNAALGVDPVGGTVYVAATDTSPARR